MSSLRNQLATAERHELSRAIRLLLANPLITESGAPETFELIRRRHDPLAKWFDFYCGWSLMVEPRLGYARLAKMHGRLDSTRPARRRRSGRAAFDRRRYTLFCVVAAELLTSPVTTIGVLADHVAQAMAADSDVPGFDTAQQPERRAFVDALRLLETCGAIEVVDGSTESFVESEAAKVLYRVDPALLTRLLSAPVGPSRLPVPAEEIPERFDDLLDAIMRESRYGTPSGTGQQDSASEIQRNLWLRHSIFRLLLDEPVVYREDLSEPQLAYLGSPTGRQLLRKAADEAGFVLEERAEGWLFADTEALATESRFPDDSSIAKVAALHLLDSLTAATAGMTPEQLRTEVRSLLERFSGWARTYHSEDGPDRLLTDALAVLQQFGLARRSGHSIRALPAAARYRLAEIRPRDDTAVRTGGT